MSWPSTVARRCGSNVAQATSGVGSSNRGRGPMRQPVGDDQGDQQPERHQGRREDQPAAGSPSVQDVDGAAGDRSVRGRIHRRYGSWIGSTRWSHYHRESPIPWEGRIRRLRGLTWG